MIHITPCSPDLQYLIYFFLIVYYRLLSDFQSVTVIFTYADRSADPYKSFAVLEKAEYFR